MISVPTKDVQLRKDSIDFSVLHKKLRSEYTPEELDPIEPELSKFLVYLDQDLHFCYTELDLLKIKVFSLYTRRRWCVIHTVYDRLKIRNLQSRIVSLQKEHQDLEKYKACLFSLRATIRKLPDEVILQVLDSACDMNDLTSRKLQAMPALVFGHVCSRWRNLASSCPDLWCRMSITMDQLDFPSFNAILRLYLYSSQLSPLILEFPENIEKLGPRSLTVCATFNALRNRWKSLRIQSTPIIRALITDATHFDMLERMKLDSWFDEPSMDSFQNASNLQSLSVWVDLEKFPSSSKFPWTRITQLEIHHCGPGLKDLIENCPNLRDLSFDLGLPPYNPCEPSVTAPKVERLKLILPARSMSSVESVVNVIFASITCPSLTSLYIEDHNEYKKPWKVKDELSAFIERSSPQLTSLYIKFISLSDLHLIDLLRRLPSLRHLTIQESPTSCGKSPITSRLLRFLRGSHTLSTNITSSVIVPRLRSLELISTDRTGNFEDKDFVKMVLSRWFPDIHHDAASIHRFDTLDIEGGTVCLHSVIMNFKKRKMDEEVYRLLRPLEEAGLQVVVTGKNYRL